MNRRSFLGGLAALFGAGLLAKIAPAATSAPAVEAVGQDGWASGAVSLRRGDVFTIKGVYAVNPLSYEQTDRLQQFVITADVAPGDTVVNISPSIIASGAYQTVNVEPRGMISPSQVHRRIVRPMRETWASLNRRDWVYLEYRPDPRYQVSSQ